MPSMKRVLVMLFSSVLVLGCQSDGAPTPRPNAGVRALQYQPSDRPPREPVDAPRPEPLHDALFPTPQSVEETPKRDLAAELNAAIGTPVDCVRDFSAPRPTKIRINVTATVRPTGMVITPSVYGSGLSVDARECVERRVETVVLAALEEPVSETVSTVVEVDYEPPVIIEDIRASPEPNLRNVRESLPKRPSIPLDAKFISGWPTDHWISGGFDGGIPMEKDPSKRVRGPKPRAIDGYEVDESAVIWTD